MTHRAALVPVDKRTTTVASSRSPCAIAHQYLYQYVEQATLLTSDAIMIPIKRGPIPRLTLIDRRGTGGLRL